jgi:hypothetical protein
LVVEARAKDEVGDGARFAGFVAVPHDGEENASVCDDGAAVSAFVITGDAFAFPEARGAFWWPMVWEGLAIGEGSVSEGAAPLGPIGGAGEREGAGSEECEEEGGG